MFNNRVVKLSRCRYCAVKLIKQFVAVRAPTITHNYLLFEKSSSVEHSTKRQNKAPGYIRSSAGLSMHSIFNIQSILSIHSISRSDSFYIQSVNILHSELSVNRLYQSVVQSSSESTRSLQEAVKKTYTNSIVKTLLIRVVFSLRNKASSLSLQEFVIHFTARPLGSANP